MSYGRAFLAGLVGAAVVSLVTMIGHARGLPITVMMLVGTVFFSGSATAWIIGMVIHLAVGGLLGLAYGAMFTWWRRAGWRAGMALAIPHLVLAGIILPLIQIVDPLAPHGLGDPGAFLSHFGPAGVTLHTVAYLLFGVVVGAMYEPVLFERLQRAAALRQRPSEPAHQHLRAS